MSPRPRVIFLGSFSDHFYRMHGYLQSAAQLGVDVDFIPAVNAERLANRISQAHYYIFNDEEAIRTISANGEKWGLPKELVQKARSLEPFANKLMVREMFGDAFPHEYFSFQDVSNLGELNRALDLENKAYVAKPVSGSCGANVVRFDTVEEFSREFAEHSALGSVLVEEFAEGRHFCLDFLWNGSAATFAGFCWKAMLFDKAPAIIGHYNFEPPEKELIERLLEKLATVLSRKCSGLSSNFHCEFVLDPSADEAKLIEINPRAPGGWLPELYSATYGFSYDYELMRNAIQRDGKVVAHFQPSALGSIVADNFFEEVLPNHIMTSNTLFERFQAAPTQLFGKFGRFLIWGPDGETVRGEYEALLDYSMPTAEFDLDELSTVLTRSHCC